MSHTSDTSQQFHAYRDRKYFPELDGIRAICIIGVVGSHLADSAAWHWLSGGLGVNVFFVLSGYLITMLALREEQVRGQLSLSAFYVRRTLRIFPLYYLRAARVLRADVRHGLGQHVAGELRGRGAVLPDVYARGAVRVRRGRGGAALAILAFVVARDRGEVLPGLADPGVWPVGLAARCSIVGDGDPAGAVRGDAEHWPARSQTSPHGDRRSSFTRIATSCGVACSPSCSRIECWFRRLRWLGTPIGTALALAAFVATQLAYEPLNSAVREIVILHAVATTALLTSILTGGGWVTRLFRTRPAVFVGRVSYGMYLFHGLGISACATDDPAGQRTD